MFKVKELKTGNIYTVYDIQRRQMERNISVYFLVYTEFGKWIYMDADLVEPVD